MERHVQMRNEAGYYLILEVAVAFSILSVALIGLGGAFVTHHRLSEYNYIKATVMEIVDGEMEILLAGEWPSVEEGTHPYVLHGEALKRLPRGTCSISRSGKTLKLEWVWRPSRGAGLRIARQGKVK